MIKLIQKNDTLINPLRHIAHNIASPVLDLIIRIYMAQIFFNSGLLKFKNYLNNDWGSTLFLFEEIHPLPGIPADIAAIAGTAGELILPICLAAGLFTRFGAVGLLIMTAVIEFIVPADYGISNPEHYVWMMLLGIPLVKGAGILSLDHWILKWIRAQ